MRAGQPLRMTVSTIIVCSLASFVLCTASMVLAEQFDLAGSASATFDDAGGTVIFSKIKGATLFPDPRCPAVSFLRVTSTLQDSGSVSLPCQFWSYSNGVYLYEDPFASAAGVGRIRWRSVSLTIDFEGTAYPGFVGPVSQLDVQLSVGPDGMGVGPHTYCGRFIGGSVNDSSGLTLRGAQTCFPPATATPTPTVTGTPPTATPTTLVPTAFRFDDADIVDPHAFPSGLGCQDVTSLINLQLQAALNGSTTPGSPVFDLGVVMMFRPLDQSLGMSPGAFGTVDIGSAQCGVSGCTDGGVALNSATYTIQNSGNCLKALQGTTGLNNLGSYASPPNQINAPSGTADGCWVSSVVPTLTLKIGSVDVPFSNVTLAGEFNATPPSTVSKGLMKAFLSKAAADTIQVGALNGALSTAFNQGTNCPPANDSDAGGSGWWFYVNFTAKKVVWSGS